MDKYIYDESNGLWYELQGDYYIPCLTLPAEKENKPISLWGQRHKHYLQEHKRTVYISLLTSGELNNYLADIDEQATDKSLDVTVNLVVSTDRFPQITQLTIIEIRSITSIIVVRFFIFLTTLCLAIINPAPQIPIYCFVYFIIFICLHQCLVQSMELKPIDSNVKREPGPVPLPFFFPWCIMPGNLMREEGMLWTS